MLQKRVIRGHIEELLSEIKIDFGGGCSATKAHVMAWLIKQGRFKKSVDIGIYRGRSFFPQALAHRDYTGGKAYGVDPYTKGDAQEVDNNEIRKEIDKFVETTDFDKLYKEVMTFRTDHKFEANSEIVRKPSNQAAADFSKAGTKFGLVHVDGNHDTKAVVEDVELYLPLVEDGGFMVLDDISWSSVKPATEMLGKRFTLVYARVDAMNDYAVFWDGTSQIKAAYLRAALGYIGEDRL